MFKELKKHKKIIVVSPQRAGSRIVSKMIAHDTGFRYVDENEFDVDNLDKLNEILKEDNIVIQAPGLMYKITEIKAFPVIVKRKICDIIKSQKRINWTYEKYELKKYGLSEGVISQVKYKEWIKQKKQLKEYKEVYYRYLNKHELFIKDRKGFNYNQTTI